MKDVRVDAFKRELLANENGESVSDAGSTNS